MLSQVFRPNPYQTYHMCHIKAQNMIDMTSMLATAPIAANLSHLE